MTSPHLKKNGVCAPDARHPGNRWLPGWAQGLRKGQSPAPGARPAPSAQLRSPGPLAPSRPQADFGSGIPAPAPKAVHRRVTCVSDDDVLEEISVSHGPEASVFRVRPISTATYLRPL